MKKILLVITVIISTICLVSCSDKDNFENNSKVKDNVMSEGKSDFVTDYYNEGIDYKNNIIFNPEQNKFVKMINDTYVEMNQNYKEINIKFDEFDFVLKWYWCKDGERILYRQDLKDFKDGTTNYGDTMAYIVTEKMSGETYLMLCKNSNHTGYLWEYPVKFDVETGEYEDVFADATIDDESVKNYEYLKNWEFTSKGIYVDYHKEIFEPELQVWNRQIINQTSRNKIYKQSELNFDNANVELKDLNETKISEVRFTSNIDGIFRSVDAETIEKAKELAMNIEMNNEPYEIDDSVDGGIHYDMWFIDGKDVLCVLNNSLGEVSVNDKCYGSDKGEFNKLMHYFDNPEVQLKFEKIGFD